jgi:hypothetical protein
VKLALIPPFRHINAIRHTGYQMALPVHWSHAGAVNAFRAAHKRGDYIIMDNGVAEAEMDPLVKTLGSQEVQERAYEISAHEIVLPDVMGDINATIRAVTDAFPFVDIETFNFMGVLQGSTMDEIKTMVHFYRNETPFVTCLGIPRHLCTTLSSERARVEVAYYIRSTEAPGEDPIDIHLLGTNPHVADEIAGYGRHFRWLHVRGVDTSMPFHAALQGITLNDSVTEVKREPNYFGAKIPATKADQTWGNIVAMKEWVRGDRG